jgi:glutathione synthase/RimK-type ligase-like ATP-grasp enzyme
LKAIKDTRIIKRIRKSMLYNRLRPYFPMPEPHYVDDRDLMCDAEIVRVNWPAQIRKPTVGIVRDFEVPPRWTKYRRFLENNSFTYGIYNIHAHDWIEKASPYDLVVGFVTSAMWQLREMYRKYYVLENYLGKLCYPSANHALLYEDKCLEAYLSRVGGIPFVNTYISHEKADALCLVEKLKYPVVCKVIPSSGSVGTTLVSSSRQCRRIVERAFSRTGRKTHTVHFRQKDYVYFQEYVPNDGYDIRVIVVSNWAFGYYRKVPAGDFRASGMNLVERRDLPEAAVRVAHRANAFIRSPMLVVDMLYGTDGQYHVIEFSPVCHMDTPELLHVGGVPGVYVIGGDGSIRFEPGRYWVNELALKEFLLRSYLPART